MHPVVYVVIVAALVVTALQLWPFLRARRMRGRQAPALEGVVPNPQRLSGRMLLYFWSPRCGMCRGMTPVVEQLSGERDDVVSVNVFDHPQVARDLGIMATPTLVLLQGGKVERLLLGAKSERQIRALLG